MRTSSTFFTLGMLSMASFDTVCVPEVICAFTSCWSAVTVTPVSWTSSDTIWKLSCVVSSAPILTSFISDWAYPMALTRTA